MARRHSTEKALLKCPLCFEGWGTHVFDPALHPGQSTWVNARGATMNPYNTWKCDECGASWYTNRNCSDWLYSQLNVPRADEMDA